MPSLLKLLQLALLLGMGYSAFGQKIIPWSSATMLGSSHSSEGRDIAVAPTGDYYVVGSFTESLDIGATHLVSQGGSDAFVAKFNGLHQPLWAKGFGGPADDLGDGIAIDADGAVGVVGNFRDQLTADAGTLTSAGSYDIFLLKLAPGGQVLWRRSMGGAYDDVVQPGNLSAFGRTFLLSGSFGKISASPAIPTTAAIGTFNLTSKGNGDAFVARYDENGNVLWAKGAGSAGSDDNVDNAADGAGNSYIIGMFSGSTMDFDAYLLNRVGSGFQVFVAKYDSAGTFVWARCIGTPSFGGVVYPSAIAADADGTVFLTGGFGEQQLNFGTIQLSPFSSGGDLDGFVACYTTAGLVQWARRCGGWSFDFSNAIVAGSSGNVYTAGYFSGPGWFDSDTLTGSGSESAFIACYAKNGSLKWASDCGETKQFSAIAEGAGNTLYLTGLFSGTPTTFPPYALYNNSGTFSCFAATTGDVTAIHPPASAADALSCYPNPAADLVMVHFPAVSEESALIIQDVSGRTVSRVTIDAGQSDLSLPLHALPEGVYQIVLFSRGVRASERIAIGR